MTDAEQAVRKAAAEIPAELSARLGGTQKLSDEDRDAIIHIARLALAPFQSGLSSKATVKAQS
jgi:F-type H+-transporting ATPase subunit alpha